MREVIVGIVALAFVACQAGAPSPATVAPTLPPVTSGPAATIAATSPPTESATPTSLPTPTAQRSTTTPEVSPTATPLSASPTSLPTVTPPTRTATATLVPPAAATLVPPTPLASRPTPTALSVPAATALPGSVNVAGAWSRSAPALWAPRAFPVFAGTPVSVVGMDATAAWYAVRGGDGQTGWLLRDFVALTASPDNLPRAAAVPAPAPQPQPLPPSITMTASARARYRAAIAAGRDGRMFTVAGACNSEGYAFVLRVATDLYDIAPLSSMHAAAAAFAPSFSRASMAAHGGYTAAALFDPAWVMPGLCPPSEGPLACEFRLTRASVLFIELGTGDQFEWREYEGRLNAILDAALAVPVLPVLVTKADALDMQQGGAPPDYINTVIRRVAAARDLPLIDFHAATRGLPNFGLLDEGNFDFHLSPEGSDLHLLLTLQFLNALLT